MGHLMRFADRAIVFFVGHPQPHWYIIILPRVQCVFISGEGDSPGGYNVYISQWMQEGVSV